MPSSLETFIEQVQINWTGLNSNTVVKVRTLLSQLAQSSAKEPWLASIHEERPAAKVLYEDSLHGFILLAHTEQKDCYRTPHDHGSGWVFYAVQHGELTMTTYKHITDRKGKAALVSRGNDTVQNGDCRVFLPGDIHDTRCASEYLVQFRLTSCDFQKEKREGRMTIFMS